jgi:hypothetical protein
MEIFIRYKKLFILIGFIATTLILGYLLYAVFFKTVPTEQPILPHGTTTPFGGRLPTAKEGPGQIVKPTDRRGLPIEQGIITPQPSRTAKGGLTQIDRLNNATSVGVTLSPNGSDLQYYNKDDGKFYRIDKNGNTYPLSDKVFHSAKNIVWSFNKDKAIIEYPDGANIIYDFSKEKQITLPKHWKDFDFSPNGKQIVMKSIGLDPDNRWLAVTNDDGSKTRIIEAIGENEKFVYTSWSPNNQTVAMYVKGIDFDRQEVFFIGLNNENFKSMVIEGRGFRPKWQPSGERLLYSVYSSKTNLKPSLWIVNARGENIGTGRKNLNVETWADKCAFAGDNEIYCAVPEKLEEGAGLFPELAKDTKDNLYKINIRTGVKKLIAVPDGSYNMSNLIISDNGKYLYFTDETTKRLYKIKLK